MLRRLGLVIAALIVAAMLATGTLLLVMVAAVELGAFSMASAASGTLKSGRAVTAESDSWSVGGEFQTDTATIRTAGRTIVVTPREVLVDGHPAGHLDENARQVDVRVKDGRITVVADGQTVADWSR